MATHPTPVPSESPTTTPTPSPTRVDANLNVDAPEDEAGDWKLWGSLTVTHALIAAASGVAITLVIGVTVWVRGRESSNRTTAADREGPDSVFYTDNPMKNSDVWNGDNAAFNSFADPTNTIV